MDINEQTNEQTKMQFNATPIDLNKIQINWEIPDNSPMKLSRDNCDREIDDTELFLDQRLQVSENDFDDDQEELLWNDEKAFDFELVTEKRNYWCPDLHWEDGEHWFPKSASRVVNNDCEEEENDEDITYMDGICYDNYVPGWDMPGMNTNDEYQEMLERPLDDPLFQPTPHLEKLDKDLSEAYYESLETPTVYAYHNCLPPTRENGAFTNNEPIHDKLIQKYKKILNIPTSEAFEYIRRCHYCGSANKPFSYTYCSERCENMHFDFDYPCNWNQERWADDWANNCKMCNWNCHYKNPSYLPDDDDQENIDDCLITNRTLEFGEELKRV